MNEEWTVIYYPYIFRGKTLSSAVVWLPLIPWLPDFSIVITLWAIAYQEFSKWVCWKLDHRLSDWKADVSRSDSLTLKSAYLKDTGMTAKVFFFFFPIGKTYLLPSMLSLHTYVVVGGMQWFLFWAFLFLFLEVPQDAETESKIQLKIT